MYQQVTMMGRLGSDPELRHTASGVPVCSFRLAIQKQWQGQDGQLREKVTWVRVTAWQKLAEVVSEYLAKGRQVLVIGDLENPQAYVSKSGELAATNEVTARTIRFLDTPETDQEVTDDPFAKHEAQEGHRRVALDIPF